VSLLTRKHGTGLMKRLVKNCPIVDTWWQTENGGFMISPIAGITPTKPGYATLPLPGVQPVLVDENGKVIEGNGVSGNLCIKFPWPGMLRTTYGDHERCRTTYLPLTKTCILPAMVACAMRMVITVLPVGWMTCTECIRPPYWHCRSRECHQYAQQRG
jgi:hypothetical protein